MGLGVIPRGEVGLIFASIGRTMHIGDERVVNDTVYSDAHGAAAPARAPSTRVARLKMRSPRGFAPAGARSSEAN